MVSKQKVQDVMCSDSYIIIFSRINIDFYLCDLLRNKLIRRKILDDIRYNINFIFIYQLMCLSP